MEAEIPKTKTKFVKIKCDSCDNEQIVFSNPSRVVKCTVCAKELVEPKGGKGKPKAKVLKDLS